jgi:hypothetical protein
VYAVRKTLYRRRRRRLRHNGTYQLADNKGSTFLIFVQFVQGNAWQIGLSCRVRDDGEALIFAVGDVGNNSERIAESTYVLTAGYYYFHGRDEY